MLGGNAEYMATSDLRKAGIPEEIITEATGYADTDNEEILEARRLFAEKLEKYRAMTAKEAEVVRAAGGLFIIGTERHESRRIDNQLRGRSGRQGDPGETRFYIAMSDDLMRLFGGERVARLMDTLRVDEDTPIDQKMLSGAIENAQKRVESRNFQSRKTVLEYDDVMNTQRNIIYEQRRKVLDGEDVQKYIQDMIKSTITGTISSGFSSGGKVTDRDELTEIVAPFERMFLPKNSLEIPEGGFTKEELTDVVMQKAEEFYAAKEKSLGMIPDTDTPLMRELERVILLRVVDEYWMDHIDAMSELRQGIGLRAYGQVNPVDAYKQEGFDMFEAMVNGIKEEVVRRIFTVRVKTNNAIERRSVATVTSATAGDGTDRRRPVKSGKKIGRNDPCPCGKLRPNGLPMKYKDCCGRNVR